jgi:replicative DNA helicase
MAKLFNSVSEAVAIRGMCSRDAKISGYLIGQLREDYFYNEESQELYRAVMEHYSTKGTTPTFGLLKEQLRVSEDARDFLKSGEIPPITSTESAQSVVNSLDEYRKTRLLYSFSKGILQALEKPKIEVDKILLKASERLTRIHTRRTTEEDFFHLGKDSNAMKLVEDILYSDNSDLCIPTGFKTFDSVNGGFLRGSLIILASSSGGGKSLMANQIAMNQARIGYKVALVPLEMTESETYSRSMANISGHSSTDIFLQRLASGEKDLVWKKMRRLDKEMSNNNGRYTVYKPREDMTIEELLASIHSLSCDVIYVDYISLLKGVDDEEQWKKLGQIARYAKVYADNHNKVVVLMCQLSDEGRVKYSQGIKEHASLAWTWTATKDSRDKGYANIELLKARNQVMSGFTLKIDYARMRVSDLDPQEMQEVQDELKRKERASAKKPADSFKPVRRSEDDSNFLPDQSK